MMQPGAGETANSANNAGGIGPLHKQRSLDSMTSPRSVSDRSLSFTKRDGTPLQQRERTLELFSDLMQRCLSKKHGPPGKVVVSTAELDQLRMAYINQTAEQQDIRRDAQVGWGGGGGGGGGGG